MSKRTIYQLPVAKEKGECVLEYIYVLAIEAEHDEDQELRGEHLRERLSAAVTNWVVSHQNGRDVMAFYETFNLVNFMEWLWSNNDKDLGELGLMPLLLDQGIVDLNVIRLTPHHDCVNVARTKSNYRMWRHEHLEHVKKFDWCWFAQNRLRDGSGDIFHVTGRNLTTNQEFEGGTIGRYQYDEFSGASDRALSIEIPTSVGLEFTWGELQHASILRSGAVLISRPDGSVWEITFWRTKKPEKELLFLDTPNKGAPA